MMRILADRLLEFVAPKATAEAADPPSACRPIGNCAYSPQLQGTLYWDEKRDTSCGCWYPRP
jgi:hypothetical protein